MLLAAGRGVRMGPLTADLPKPLLSLGAETLIERHLRRLAAAGFREIVINLSYRGEQIRSTVGDSTRWGQAVVYTEEGEPPLETAGGIVHALPWLGDDPFLVVSADVVTDYDFRALEGFGPEFGRAADRMAGEFTPSRNSDVGALGYLVVVPNPPHHPDGDFWLTPDGRLLMPEGALDTPESCPDTEPPSCTFSGIAVLHPALFRDLAPGIRPLREVLRPAVRRGALLGEVFQGLWRDVGTPERLADARALMGGRHQRPSRETAG